MLTDDTLNQILQRIPALRIGVLGDLFLDRYLDIDAALTEPSVETGLDAYQVTRVRSYPGAAGTVVNNLAALGVLCIEPIAVIGDDGEGYELRQALARLPAVTQHALFSRADRRTPTYTKPMLCLPGAPPRELNRLDIKNRERLPTEAEDDVLRMLDQLWPTLDALLVLDQVSEENCGVVSERVRQRISELGASRPDTLILADSRRRIGSFKNACLKPNEKECLHSGGADVSAAAIRLARDVGRSVFCTRGDNGILVVQPDGSALAVPAYPVNGPVDPVGAGDSTSAALACAIGSGSNPAQAAAFGNLVASITIQQIGITGTASQQQIRDRWREVR